MKNNDTKNGFPIKDGRDYRQLCAEFHVRDTSFLKLKSMSVVAKSIDCDNSKNVMYCHMWGYDEGGLETKGSGEWLRY